MTVFMKTNYSPRVVAESTKKFEDMWMVDSSEEQCWMLGFEQWMLFYSIKYDPTSATKPRIIKMGNP
ncbi:hypothetical protein KIN20_032926 [Parelaphostrongylus tenuis]|uniref:Uncharacterized protein n=1 Tax=Parelaphostrongylus tenuis TaxID=148309 RepID=A0AAD5R7M9_PARTN|nr:hypothetical protein KIN20_032926 [Parelaphostrongylus tenuis]